LQNYQNLEVWQKSHLLTVEVYKLTKDFPKDELYGLTSQIRRACVLIPSNIAEGCSRNSDTDFNRYLTIALGSANELEYQLLLARDLKLLLETDYTRLNLLLTEIRKQLITFIKKLK
jgi:four helix bundle protein